MPAPLDLTGQLYGSLRVLRLWDGHRPGTSKGRWWLCRCEEPGCGRERPYASLSLRQAGQDCCPDCATKSKRVDLRGHVFGALVPIERMERPDDYGNVRWLCSCECGGWCILAAAALKQSRWPHSCGCRSAWGPAGPRMRQAAMVSQEADDARPNPEPGDDQ